MSCTFWLRRHKAAAKKREQERLEAEKATEMKEKVFNEEPVVEVKKPRKKAVESNDNA